MDDNKSHTTHTNNIGVGKRVTIPNVIAKRLEHKEVLESEVKSALNKCGMRKERCG